MPTLRASELETAHRISHELAQFKAAETEAALEFLLKGLQQLLEADDAFWVGAVRMQHGAAAARDPQHGWRGRGVKLLNPPPARIAVSASAMKGQDRSEPPLTTIAVARAAGKFRAVRMRDLVDMTVFRQTEHYRSYYQGRGIQDRMWISFPVNPQTESHFVLDRTRRGGRFTARELALAAYLLRPLAWFHGRALLSYGLLIARTPLSPMQRRVLALLLTDAPEKTIAATMRQSFHTTHTHVRDVFRRFGVTSRTALMAVWLNGR